MKALFIILNHEDDLDDVFSILVDQGVKGATIVDSQGMGSAIVKHELSSIPLFGSLKNLLKDRNPYNKTIFSVIHKADILQAVVRDIQNYFDVNETKGGLMFTLPVDDLYVL